MPSRHDAFVHIENIKSFQLQLGTETDPAKRKLLVELLARETLAAPPVPGPRRPAES